MNVYMFTNVQFMYIHVNSLFWNNPNEKLVRKKCYKSCDKSFRILKDFLSGQKLDGQGVIFSAFSQPPLNLFEIFSALITDIFLKMT